MTTKKQLDKLRTILGEYRSDETLDANIERSLEQLLLDLHLFCDIENIELEDKFSLSTVQYK